MSFGPIDGNQENTALENWFPISAQELEQQREQIRLLRETNKAAQTKRAEAERESAALREQLAEREAFHCERVADLHKKFADMRDWYEARLKGILDPMVQIKMLQLPAPVIFENARPGYALVPVEPTEGMIEALIGTPWIVECTTEIIDGVVVTTNKEYREQRYITDGWEAMLEASKEGGE